MQKENTSLSSNSLEVLKRRYLLKDNKQNVIETPEELFRRVVRHVSFAERNFKTSCCRDKIEEDFYNAMKSLEFLPNSPTLMNAGTPLGQLSACFVIPVADSIDGIFESLKSMAKIHQTGGGTGFSFSRLRPKGDLVSTTKGAASGPVSFMSIFDAATGVIVQGGRRRGANMGVLRCDHPDIVEFIEAKTQKEAFSNFNLSVGITDSFMKAVKLNKEFSLINPRTNKIVRKVNARATFNLIASAAWKTGDPGIIFLDNINRANPTPAVGRIEATNPCGELPLLPYESCNLGSINLSRMISAKRIDYERLASRVRLGIRFLDNVIEVNKYPLPEIKKVTFANRKIGLGVMGFADMLVRLGIPYDSDDAVSLAGKLMRFIKIKSIEASVELAKERGVFPNYARSIYSRKGIRLRNATVNTIAPTGSISIIAGCSSGIEPLFAISFTRNVLSGLKLFEVNSIFEETAKARGFYNPKLLARIARLGSLRGIKAIPADVRKLFVTAFDVEPEQHLKIQAAFQQHTDNSVSKTINLPPEATIEDVRKIFMEAYLLKLKGITVYRYGSRKDQVISFGYGQIRNAPAGGEGVVAESEYSGGCATGTCPF
ncbi:MAG: adenosylcobalamin-dependent ribonucleoside-diphosphate reductase [Candidatus Omnitrophica bacterium]|nr:adenosylcobalamin-dependent ribonucleoside-diphosphate reductase [Candidatus Omnitrophota bacterium]